MTGAYWGMHLKSFDNSHTAVIRGAEDIEPLSKRLMSFTVNKQVTTASAMLQSCMLVLSDETTKIQAVDHDREASINENQKPKFSS